MFFIWAIPLFLLIVLTIWIIFFRLRRRVDTGHRKEGKVLRDG